MLRRATSHERAQVLPLWTFGILACLGLTFFVANYANQIRWSIRAQNAADVASTGGMVADATVNNQIDMQLYGLALDEVRIRYLNQAAANLLNGNACVSANCAQDYAAVLNALQNAVDVYDADGYAQLKVADNLTKGGLQKYEGEGYTLASTASGCTNTPPIGDCTNNVPTFAIHQIGLSGGVSDVYACKSISLIAPSLLGISAATRFKAIARSTVGLTSVNETFQPGITINPKTLVPYAQKWDPSPDPGTLTTVDFTSFTPTIHFFTVGPVQPTATFKPSTATC